MSRLASYEDEDTDQGRSVGEETGKKKVSEGAREERPNVQVGGRPAAFEEDIVAVRERDEGGAYEADVSCVGLAPRAVCERVSSARWLAKNEKHTRESVTRVTLHFHRLAPLDISPAHDHPGDELSSAGVQHA